MQHFSSFFPLSFLFIYPGHDLLLFFFFCETTWLPPETDLRDPPSIFLFMEMFKKRHVQTPLHFLSIQINLEAVIMISNIN